MALDIIDGELCLVEGEEITHVFERGELDRPAYKHMCGWMQTNFDSKLKIDEQWEAAGKAWEDLSSSHKSLIWSMAQQETRNAQDICEGLLATLAQYQGTVSVKSSFISALRETRDRYM